MLTTRIRPKMSEKPLATTNKSAASVRVLRTVTRKSLGLLMAGPKFVCGAQKRTHTRAKIAAASATAVGRRRRTWRQSTARGFRVESEAATRPQPGGLTRDAKDPIL